MVIVRVAQKGADLALWIENDVVVKYTLGLVEALDEIWRDDRARGGEFTEDSLHAQMARSPTKLENMLERSLTSKESP